MLTRGCASIEMNRQLEEKDRENQKKDRHFKKLEKEAQMRRSKELR